MPQHTPLKRRKAAAPSAKPGKFAQQTLRQEVQRLVRSNNERVPGTRQRFEAGYSTLAHGRSMRGTARMREMLRREVERKNPKLYGAILGAFLKTKPKKGGVLEGIIIFGGTARGYHTPKDIDYMIVVADSTPDFKTSINRARVLHQLLGRELESSIGAEAESFERMRFINLEDLASTARYLPSADKPWFFMGSEKANNAIIRVMEQARDRKPR